MTTNAVLNLILDFVCSLGNTTRLAKSLRENGLSPRILSHDTIRIRERFRLVDGGERSLNKLQELLDFVKLTHPLWNTTCVELWAEFSVEYRGEPVVLEYNNLCIYARTGVNGRLVIKLAWIAQCRRLTGGSIPEGITRFCTTDPASLDKVKDKLLQFASTLPLLPSTLKPTSS